MAEPALQRWTHVLLQYTGASQRGDNAEDVQSPQISCMCLRRCFVRYRSDQYQLRKHLLMFDTLISEFHKRLCGSY